MYDIDWTKIKNGAKGFEELARAYVKDVFEFPYGRWKETSLTHDGNKDAYTIIIGFHPNLTEDEIWWMEAKYSTEKVYLSRFKLDATIVSSIFNRSVKKIIFVTNIDIKAKVISDVRTALFNATSCKEVHFCTKKAIEFWLYQNLLIYKKFFDGTLPTASKLNDLFVSEDITIYSALNTMRDVTSLCNLSINKLYEANFKIVSNCTQKITINPAQKGIKRLSESSVDIQQGENILVVRFKIEDNFFSYKKRSIDGIEENNLCFFKINKKIPVMTLFPISISRNGETQLKIESQIKFEKDFKMYKFKHYASYWLIDGTTGCGKTTLIQRCAEEKALKNINYRYIKFSNNISSNYLELISTIFFILFPYMYIEDITLEYLETLDIGQHLKKILCAFKKNITTESQLLNYIDTLLSKEIALYPDEVQNSSKIIVLDDIHLLNENNIVFLFFILKTAQKLPIMFILASHSYFMDNTVFKLNKSQLALEHYHLELTINDIIENMKSQFSFTFDISNSLIEYFFPNIIIFNLYISYIIDLKNSIVSLEDFILSYIQFKRNYVSDEYINRQFMIISEKYPTAWKVCQEIYTHKNGVSISDDNRNDISYLLKMGLIKYDEFNNLIPINEIYIIHYRKKYLSITESENPIENIVCKLSNMLLPDELEYYYQKIHLMRCNEEFQTVNYILETVFESSSLEMYKKTWGEEMFYLLYFEYTYAAINCNTMLTGYDNLYEIYENIKDTSSNRLGLLLLETIFELINCDYNNSSYSKCKEYYEIFNKQFSILARKGEIENDCTKNLFWVLSAGYMLLIDAEEAEHNCEKVLLNAKQYREFLLENYPFHYINFCSQFSKTMYIRDWDLACEWQKLAYEAVVKREDSESKQVLKIGFNFYFTQYLRTQNASYLKKMHEHMSLGKNKIYSSYRHQLFLYCGLLYILDSIDEADTLFVRDVISLRPIRQKMKGQYYVILSLHFLKHQNIKEAQINIEKASQIFKGLKSYENIVLHNERVLKNVSLPKIQFKFCTSELLRTDTFYLDPRI